MNLVGKIFIVFNLAASVAFAAFAAVVVFDPENWRAVALRTAEEANEHGKPLGLVPQLENRKAIETDLDAQNTHLDNTRLRLEQESKQRLSQLEARLTEAIAELAQEEKDYAGTDQANPGNVAQLRTLQAELDSKIAVLNKNNAEIDQLRIVNTKLIKDREAAFVAVRELESQLAQQEGELSRLQDQNKEIDQRTGKLANALSRAGVSVGDSGPPDVQGVILAALEDGLIEISLGKDDGLNVGNILDAFRIGRTVDSTRYLGQIRIVRAEDDRSVGEVVPGTLKEKIQQNDRVATRLTGI